MSKVEKIEDGEAIPLRVTRRKERQVSSRRSISARVRVKCGCCDKVITICHDETLYNANVNTLEINGVIGTLAQWRAIFGPLLSFQEVQVNEGVGKVTWESTI